MDISLKSPLLVVLLLASLVLAADKPSPVVDFDSAMETFFAEDSGLVDFRDYVIVFAPEGELRADVALFDSKGKELARFPFLGDYRMRAGVFAKAGVRGPANVKLDTPGEYTIVWSIDAAPVTRMPFILESTGAGDDPFKPDKTFRVDGPWRTLAHLTTRMFKDQVIPVFNLWVGGKDLADAKARDSYLAALYRNGGSQPVAHGRLEGTFIPPGKFARSTFELFHPHDKKGEATAKLFAMKDLVADGSYTLRLTRKSDNAVIREFHFTAADGAIRPMDRALPDHRPRTEYLAPRVKKKGAGNFAVVEAIWLDGSPKEDGER